MRVHSLAIVLLLSLTQACHNLGPRTVLEDRFNYQQALSRSGMEQLLLNIVKVRYTEAPLFLEVGQIVSGYTLEGQLSASGRVDMSSDGNILLGGAVGRYIERPTITYAPISGRRFIEMLFKPIPHSTLVSLIEAGYPADLLLRLAVQSVNGLRNRTWRQNFVGEPGFFRFADSLERMQRDGWIGVRVEGGDLSKELETVLYFESDNVPPEVASEIASIKTSLGLDLAATSYKVTSGPTTVEANVVNLQTRSMLRIILELSAGVEVPAEHLEHGWARPELDLEEDAPPPLITIHSGTERPADAYCAVRVREHWFWIEQSDQLSKSVFAFILLIFNIAESGQAANQPQVTIPTG